MRSLSQKLLIIVLVAFALSPLLLLAQDTAVIVSDTAVVSPGTPLSLETFLSYAITAALGLLTPYAMRALEYLSVRLKSADAMTKRAVVVMITGGVTMGCSLLAAKFPWFPWNPEPLNGLVMAVFAIAAHAGDKAKANAAAAP